MMRYRLNAWEDTGPNPNLRFRSPVDSKISDDLEYILALAKAYLQEGLVIDIEPIDN